MKEGFVIADDADEKRSATTSQTCRKIWLPQGWKGKVRDSRCPRPKRRAKNSQRRGLKHFRTKSNQNVKSWQSYLKNKSKGRFPYSGAVSSPYCRGLQTEGNLSRRDKDSQRYADQARLRQHGMFHMQECTCSVGRHNHCSTCQEGFHAPSRRCG